MRYTSALKTLALAAILAGAAALSAQNTTNPINQIRWPLITGSGAPTMTCQATAPPPANSSAYGQTYIDMTGGHSYICQNGGWKQQPMLNIVGTGAPVASCSPLAHNGAIYNNTTAGTLYFCDGAASTWRGPFGATGQIGPVGPVGPPIANRGDWTATPSPPYALGDIVGQLGSTWQFRGGTNIQPPGACPASNAAWQYLACVGGATITGANNNAVNIGPGGTAQDSGAQARLMNTPQSSRVLKVATADANGFPTPPFQILIGGNSKVLGNNSVEVVNFCTVATQGQFGSLPLFRQGACRNSVSYSSASNIVSLVVQDNSDGYVQVGDRISIGINAANCMAIGGSFYVTGVSGNTITFDTTGSAGACGNVSSTSINVVYTKQIQLFGKNGSTLASWVSGTDQWSWSGTQGMQAYAQSLIAKGIIPVMWIADGCIGTNSVRLGGMSYGQYMAGCDSFLDKLEATAATRPDGKVVTLAQYPVFLDNGNTFANGGVNWTAGPQGVFPNGTTGSLITTPPVITAATQGGSSVSTIAAGTQAIVTLNYCPNDLWGGPGIAAPKGVTFAGQLVRENNPIQMVLDTTGSGVQETVTLQPFNLGTGNTTTGIQANGAGTQTGTLSCIVSFTAANAHAVSGLQIVTTRSTADQAYSQYIAQSVYDEAARYANITPVDFQKYIYGKQSIGSDKTQWGAGDEVHPTASGYQRQEQFRQAVIAPYFNTALATAVPAKDVLLDDLFWLKENQNNDADFSELRTTKARVNGTFYNPVGDSDWCLSDNLFYTTFEATVNQIASTFLRVNTTPALSTQTTWAGDVQTGDWIYSPIFGCWQPTTIASPTFFATNAIAMNITGNPPVPLASIAGQLKFRRMLAVDALSIPFIAHPDTYKTVLVGKIVSGAANTFTFSLNPGQRRDVPFGITASQITLVPADHVVVQGNGGTIPTGGVDLPLPAGGVFSVSGSNGVWTDTTGTNYSVYAAQPMNIFLSRPLDVVATSVQASNVQAYGGVTVPSLAQPSLILAALTSTPTGGNLSNGTYFYKYTIRPLGNALANSSAASTEQQITISGGTATQRVIINPFSTARAAGYVYDIYRGTSSGTEGYVGSTTTTATTYTDTGATAPGAAPPTVDLSGSNGNVLFDGAAPTAAGQTPSASAIGSRKVVWATTKFTVAFTPAAATASSCVEQAITATGATTGQSVSASPPASMGTHVWIGSVRVSAANTVQVSFCADATGGTPPSGNWLLFAQ